MSRTRSPTSLASSPGPRPRCTVTPGDEQLHRTHLRVDADRRSCHQPLGTHPRAQIDSMARRPVRARHRRRRPPSESPIEAIPGTHVDRGPTMSGIVCAVHAQAYRVGTVAQTTRPTPAALPAATIPQPGPLEQRSCLGPQVRVRARAGAEAADLAPAQLDAATAPRHHDGGCTYRTRRSTSWTSRRRTSTSARWIARHAGLRRSTRGTIFARR